MKHLTLSIKDVEKKCFEISEKIIIDNFKPDCVVYIKTGGYLVGKYVADYFNIPLSGLRVSRSGNTYKEKAKVILKILPTWLKKILREIEIKSGIHKKKNKRIVTEFEDLRIVGNNILLIDDSVDTGNSIIYSTEFLKKNYGQELNIKVAALNKFRISEEKVDTYYYIYEDHIIIYPWSKDSKEYYEFMNLYLGKDKI